MANLSITHHAEVRMQQRGIPSDVVNALAEYGTARYDHHGGQILFLDKKARQRLVKASEIDARHIDRYLGVYLVRSLDGALLTVGHRNKRFPRQ